MRKKDSVPMELDANLLTEKRNSFANRTIPIKKENAMAFGPMDAVHMEKDVNSGIRKWIGKMLLAY